MLQLLLALAHCQGKSDQVLVLTHEEGDAASAGIENPTPSAPDIKPTAKVALTTLWYLFVLLMRMLPSGDLR